MQDIANSSVIKLRYVFCYQLIIIWSAVDIKKCNAFNALN